MTFNTITLTYALVENNPPGIRGSSPRALETRANRTVHTYLYGVKKWLEVNGVDVRWDRVEMPTTSVTFEKDRALTIEEIIKLLNHAAQIKDRVAILVLASSGLRIGTLLSSKWGDVDFEYPDVARITVKRAIDRARAREKTKILEEKHTLIHKNN